MIEVLEFIFKDFWHFAGVCFLILWIGICAGIARAGIRIK
jgi:hypothetical protein